MFPNAVEMALFDRYIGFLPTKLKNKVYKTACYTPAIVYGADCWAVKKNWRGSCTQLKCACSGRQEEGQDEIT